MKLVVGVGASVLDTVIQMDTYPEEDHKFKANKVFSTGGGPVGNALVAISKLGTKAAFLGTLSKDATGDTLINEFNKYGVDTSSAVQVDGTAAFTSFIVLTADKGTRTIAFDRGSVPDDPKLVNFDILDKASILHLDGNYLNIALEAAKYAKERNILVSLDAGGLYPNIEKVLPYVDILIPSEEFAKKISNKDNVDDAIRWLDDKYHPTVLVVTMGSEGGKYLENGVIKSYPCFKVDCVDSNGAGDTFHGAFLVAYLDGKSILDCCLFASATSAIKCTKAGVRAALPNKETVINFLNNK